MRIKPKISVNVRIEICLSKEDARLLGLMAKDENRSRKNFCEVAMRKIIDLSSLIPPIKLVPPALKKPLFDLAGN